MKVLSIKNPWAYFIIYGSDFGHKDVENRTWETKYRGSLLIHCSKNLDANFPRGELPLGVNWQGYSGRIIGRVHVVDCVRNSKSLWAENGMWHWVLRDPIPLKNPILARGALGLWNYEGNEKENSNG